MNLLLCVHRQTARYFKEFSAVVLSVYCVTECAICHLVAFMSSHWVAGIINPLKTDINIRVLNCQIRHSAYHYKGWFIFRQLMAVYSESHRKRVSRLCGQNLISECTGYVGRDVAESVSGLFS